MKLVSVALATASAITLAAATGTAAHAQPAAQESTLGEIVVTARRKSESLQEVPQVVNAVTADTLQKLNIRSFQDVASVVPGLSLQYNNTGNSGTASMRGVTFVSTTSAQPSVAFYLNDASIQSNFLFQTMFDVGQVEVLRGPQGTQRGVPAPSGAITVTTRRPDLGEFGGYIDVSASDLQARNVNGAINIPIIRDVLGVRLAGLFEQNTGDGTRSIYSKLKPFIKTSAFRTTVSFEPSDAFNANIAWTHLDTSKQSFVPVTGLGTPAIAPNITFRPPIAPLDRVAAADEPATVNQHFDTVQLHIDSRIFGQHLAYVGSGSHQKYFVRDDRDQGQNLVGVPFISTIQLSQEWTTQELRLMSDPAPGRFFDYVVGAYYDWQRSSGQNVLPASFLPGAFGPTNNLSIANFDPQFSLPQVIPTPSFLQTTSIFGSVTFHLGSKTEFTAGARHIWAQAKTGLKVRIDPGQALVTSPVCAGILRPGTFPGTCIAPVTTGVGVVAQPAKTRVHDEYTIYNLQLSHRFSRDLLVYGNVGTAFRPPFGSIGNFANAENDPVIASFLVHPSETSRAFELGAKWTFLDGRGRLNAAIFKQKLKFTPVLSPTVPYLSVNGVTPPSVQSAAFTASPDGVIEGFDVDAAFQITPQWSISGQIAYADGRVSGGSNSGMPCNDSNFDGQPDAGVPTVAGFRAAGVHVALCSGLPLSQEPYWNASFQSEYVQPVTDSIDAYVRGLVSYYPENTRRTSAVVIDNYTLVNLYAGVRAHDGGWEAGLFVKNAFKEDKLLDRKPTPLNASLNAFNGALPRAGTPGFPPPFAAQTSNYFEKLLTPRREVGINVRYAFGSR